MLNLVGISSKNAKLSQFYSIQSKPFSILKKIKKKSRPKYRVKFHTEKSGFLYFANSPTIFEYFLSGKHNTENLGFYIFSGQT